jgi:hypothetical protein
MFRSLTIEGLGPHSNTVLDLSPNGIVDITGPSQAGKSLIVDALCWCLWGVASDGKPLDAALLRAGEALQVSVTTGRGTTFARTRTGVTVTPPGLKAVRCTTQAALAPHLKALADADLGRLILAPMAWLALANGPGEGRALREFLARVLPGPTADDLLDNELSNTEPRGQKSAEAARRDARKRVDQLTGGLAQAKAAPIGLEPVKPDAFKGLEAAALIAQRDEAREAAAAAKADHASWCNESNAHVTARDARKMWARRRDAIQRPERERIPVTEAMTQAAWDEVAANEAASAGAAARRDAITKHRADKRAYLDALDRLAYWKARVPSLPDGTAPTPDEVALNRAAVDAWEAQRRESPPVRPEHPRGWVAEASAEPCSKASKSCQIVTRAQTEANAATLRNAIACDNWEAWEASRLPLPTDASEVLTRADRWRAYEAAKAACGERPTVPADPGPEPEPIQVELSTAAQDAVKDARAANAMWTAYEAATAALGDEPAEPAPLRPEPAAVVVPEVPEWALQVTRDHATYATRLTDWRERAFERDARVTGLQGELDDATTEAERAETVLELIRTAPGRALAGKLATLGDLGPVRLEVSDDALTVTVDGRPWRVASTGRRIVADAWFRQALRTAVGMGWLPVVVDEAQSVGGMPIPTTGPAWIIRTVASGLLQSVAR